MPLVSNLTTNEVDNKFIEQQSRHHQTQNQQQSYSAAVNALESQLKIKQQLKEQLQQEHQLHEALQNQEHQFPLPLLDVALNSTSGLNLSMSYSQHKGTNKSQLNLASDSLTMSVTESKHAYNGSMSSIRSEQHLCQLYNAQKHSDYIISDYMDKIATRISLLETELKFAWRALDLLSNEYGKIWTRLEKLENISAEQQSVVGNLMGLVAGANQSQHKTDLSLDMDGVASLDKFLSMNNLPMESNINASIGIERMELLKVNQQNTENELNSLNELNMEVTSDKYVVNNYADELFSDTATEYDLDGRHRIGDNDNDEFFHLFENQVQSPQEISINGCQELDIDPWMSYSFPSPVGLVQGNTTEQAQLYSNNSSVMMYEQQQKMANNARVELLKKFLNGQRVLEQVESVTPSASASQASLDNLSNLPEPELDHSHIVSNDTKDSTNINELDELIEEVKFFRLTAVKAGQGGNEVVPIEDTGGTTISQLSESKIIEQRNSEMTENFYKNLNEEYRENHLSSEISKMEQLLQTTNIPSEHHSMSPCLRGNRLTSSLMMIYEGNEDEMLQIGKNRLPDLTTFTSTISTTITNSVPTSESSPYKSKELRKARKKKHYKNEMDMINNLKTVLSQATIDSSNKTTTIDRNVDSNHLPNLRSLLQDEDALVSENLYPPKFSILSRDDDVYLHDANIAILDYITDVMIREINKIKDLQSLSGDQIFKLRQTIRAEQIFFEKLNQVDKNLTLLLLNPVTMAEELQRLRIVDIEKKFDLVIKKFTKNIDTLKKLVGNSFETYKKKTKHISEPISVSEIKASDKCHSLEYQNLNQLSQSTSPNDYSALLLRNNSDLDEQLKLLETQEIEINFKRNIQQVKSTYNETNDENLVDVTPKDELLNRHKHNKSVNSTDATLSSTNIYNQDEYIRSLKRSLDRHNSMLFLLHLQNPEKHKISTSLDDMLLGPNGTSPPPPAPTDIFEDILNMTNENISINPFLVEIQSDEQNQQHHKPIQTINYSPRQAKSDSGLSSMSGWSPNSPVIGGNTHNGNVSHNKYKDISVEMIQMMINLPVISKNKSASTTKLITNVAKDIDPDNIDAYQQREQKEITFGNDYIFSEENLNYIHELSKNIPICSVYENKSIFNAKPNLNKSSCTVDEMFEGERYRHHQIGPFAKSKDATNKSQNTAATKKISTMSETNRIPDLLRNEMQSQKFNVLNKMAEPFKDFENYSRGIISHQESDIKNEQTRKPNLTDRLVYYPSSVGIDDSDTNNLDYLDIKECDRFQSQSCLKTIKSPDTPLIIQSHSFELVDELDSKGIEIDQGQNIQLSSIKSPKVWNKISHLLQDNLKLKRSVRYNRSHSLPGDDSTHREAGESQIYCGPAAPNTLDNETLLITNNRSRSTGRRRNTQLSKRIQKLPMRIIQRATSAISTSDQNIDQYTYGDSLREDNKQNKKRTLSIKINSLMRKAKTYKRHSLSHLNSEIEMELNINQAKQQKNISDNERSINNCYVDYKYDEFQNKNKSYGETTPQHYYPTNSAIAESNLFAIVGDLKRSSNTDSQLPTDSDTIGEQNDNVNIQQPENLVNLNEDYSINKTICEDLKTSRHLMQNAPPSFRPDDDSENCSELVITQTFDPTIKCETSTSMPLPQPPLLVAITFIEKTSATTTTSNSTIVTKNSASQQQQSLDIPGSLGNGCRDDDDNRSQHSGRTLSSSRRQSTEDSIDTDDEYFCYELRQLEELERTTETEESIVVASSDVYDDDGGQSCEGSAVDNAVLFSQIDQLATSSVECDNLYYPERQISCNASPQFDTEMPDESAKEKMSRVLAELKCVVRLHPDVQTNGSTGKKEKQNSQRDSDRLTKVSDMHRAWQDANSDFQLPVALDQKSNVLSQSPLQALNDKVVFNNEQLKGLKKRKHKKGKKNFQDLDTETSAGDISSDSSSSYSSHLENIQSHNISYNNEFKSQECSSSATSGPDTPADLSDDGDANQGLNNVASDVVDVVSNVIQNNLNDSAPITNDKVQSSVKLKSVDSSNNIESVQMPINAINGAGSTLGSSKWKLLKTLKERKIEDKNIQDKIKEDELAKDKEKNGTGAGDVGLRSNGHPGDNPFYSNIDSMPDIRPRRKSIPLVSELVLKV
ncbi:uncharacterized protein LOC117573250 isoform X5 [Drosophila albomicans]|uniref:Uncharacterized protein LOC117573250 isoform X5 n=1 Tax=Drosophila albomicans TaxID=7291 RepID=A0A9C6T0D0_DROAB|nr:uncharacterized protein LOC117573250 isoform X5 [Drosophila albomicans]